MPMIKEAPLLRRFTTPTVTVLTRLNDEKIHTHRVQMGQEKEQAGLQDER